MQPRRTKKNSATLQDKKKFCNLSWEKITQPLGNKIVLPFRTTTKNPATSRDKNNPATSWDQKKSRNIFGQQKIMQPIRKKQIMQPLGKKQITHPLRTKNITPNHANSWDKKIMQPRGT